MSFCRMSSGLSALLDLLLRAGELIGRDRQRVLALGVELAAVEVGRIDQVLGVLWRLIRLP